MTLFVSLSKSMRVKTTVGTPRCDVRSAQRADPTIRAHLAICVIPAPKITPNVLGNLNMTKRTLASTDRDRLRERLGPFGPRDCLLKILDLLADLLQFGLAADDALGNCGVIGFRSERVEFAKNLLRDEFKCASNRLFAAQMMSKL